MRKIIYITAEEILEIHEILIREFGGTTGLRDRGLLESATYRPQSGYYENLYEQAAALLESLILNHVFADGNKRVAFAATKVFLLVNRIHLQVDADTAETFLIKEIIKNRCELSKIAEWLKKHSKALK
jgi:death-on-curing protein